MDDRDAPPAPVRGKVEEIGQAPRLLDPDLHARILLFLRPLLLAFLGNGRGAAQGEGDGFGFDDAGIGMVAREEPAATLAAAAGHGALPPVIERTRALLA